MDYKKIYYSLVEKAKKRSKDLEIFVKENKIHYHSLDYQKRYIKNILNVEFGYIEVHHIIPKCDGRNK